MDDKRREKENTVEKLPINLWVEPVKDMRTPVKVPSTVATLIFVHIPKARVNC